MKKEQLAIICLAMFAVVFVLGCIGGEEEVEETTEVTVTPTQAVAGGTVTLQYTLINEFENDMDDVTISLLGVPSNYRVPTASISQTSLIRNQQYPAIFTIETPDINIKQTLTPKLKICYTYDTDYFFDSALKTTELAIEEAVTESGQTSGPIAISQLGFDTLFTNTQSHAGSLQITNTGDGDIIKFNTISLAAPITRNIDKTTLSYSACDTSTSTARCDAYKDDECISMGCTATCGDFYSAMGKTNAEIDDTCGSTRNKCVGASGRYADIPTKLVPDDSNCKILKDSLAIANGITATAKVDTTDDADDITDVVTERLSGTVGVDYCYEVPVGTITVCPAGKEC